MRMASRFLCLARACSFVPRPCRRKHMRQQQHSRQSGEQLCLMLDKLIWMHINVSYIQFWISQTNVVGACVGKTYMMACC
jgi:hypothetical protein